MNFKFKKLFLTTIIFLITQFFLWLTLLFSDFDFFELNTWIRWDSGHYLGIAKTNYEFFPCAGKFGYPLDAKELCGNTGWFPGYPMLIKFFSLLYNNYEFVAVFLSKSFYFFSIYLVIILSQIEKICFKNIIYLLLPSFFFGFIYYNSVFPISMVIFFSLLSFYFFLKNNIWLVSLCSTIVAFTYPTGFLLSISYAIYLIVSFVIQRDFKLLFQSILVSFFGFLGVLLVFINFQLEVGDWSAFIQVQAKYGHGIHNPLSMIFATFKQSLNLTLNNTHNIQTVLVILFYLLLIVIGFYKKVYQSKLLFLSFIYTTLFFIFPWIVGGDLSRYRAEALLLPSIFLIQHLNLKYLVVILSFFVVLGLIMSHLFFTMVLV
jgi:hypothetical protein